jgi:hypothetical protein
MILSAYLYPQDVHIRSLIHLLAYGSSIAIYWIWLYLFTTNKRASLLAIFIGVAIRMGLFIITGIILLILYPDLLRSGLVTYAISACFFLFFEIFALSTLQFKPDEKIENK